MATSIYYKFQPFIADLYNGEHDFSSAGGNQYRIALSTNISNTWGDLTSASQPSYTNLVGTDPTNRNITINSSSQTGGSYSLVFNDLTLEASGGSVGPFQYVIVFNATNANKVVGYFDYGQSVTINDGESFVIDFGADGGSTGTLITAS